MKPITAKVGNDWYKMVFYRRSDDGFFLRKNDRVFMNDMVLNNSHETEKVIDQAFEENNPQLILQNDDLKSQIRGMIAKEMCDKPRPELVLCSEILKEFTGEGLRLYYTEQ